MIFVQDTFESIHRRKKLAAWLATLKGPTKPQTNAPNFGALSAYMDSAYRLAAAQASPLMNIQNLQNAESPRYATDLQYNVGTILGPLWGFKP